MSTIAERLARWSQELTFEHLPAEVVHEVKRRVIDSFGCALGAYSSDPGRIAREMATGSTVERWARNEINTSITSIMGMTQTLLSDDKTDFDDSTRREIYRIIEHECNRLAQLLEGHEQSTSETTGLGGYLLKQVTSEARASMRPQSAASLATVLGINGRTLADLAAFANGTMVRYLDFNDTYLSKEPAHPSDNIPACLAVAESEGRSGQDLILAIAIAYEVQCRLCDAASIRARGWDHVTYGSYSSTLAAAKLMNLNVDETVHALGIAGTTGNYMRQTRAGELSMWKAAAFAAAARNAVFSASLAKRGSTGPAPIFEGQFGFWNQVSGPFELAPLAGESQGDDSQTFKILDTYIKRWPVEYHAQSGVDVALQLRGEISSIDDIEKINIRTFDACVDIIADEAKWNPTTRESADHSLPYCVAVAFIDGEVTMDSFSDARISDPAVRALMQKISVHRDAECNAQYPEGIPNDIEITLKVGKTMRKKVIFPRGHCKNPMSDEEVESKFRMLAGPWLSAERTSKILQQLWNLDKMKEAREAIRIFGDW